MQIRPIINVDVIEIDSIIRVTMQPYSPNIARANKLLNFFYTENFFYLFFLVIFVFARITICFSRIFAQHDDKKVIKYRNL